MPYKDPNKRAEWKADWYRRTRAKRLAVRRAGRLRNLDRERANSLAWYHANKKRANLTRKALRARKKKAAEVGARLRIRAAVEARRVIMDDPKLIGMDAWREQQIRKAHARFMAEKAKRVA